jgi:hypothetical protein
MTAAGMAMLRYQPFYCEENIWWLCAEPPAGTRMAYVVFVASLFGACPIAAQRTGVGEARVAWWDYHCIGLDADCSVWDLDSRLPQPVAAERWLALSFPQPSRLPESLRPRFRVLPSADYREHFASDRRHMRAPDGAWLRDPPPWPCIGDGFDLPRYRDVGDAAGPGRVMDLEAFATFVRAGC